MMKKLFQIILVLLITLPFLNACKEDDNNEKVEKPSILGTWGITQFNFDISVSDISLADYLVDSLNFSSQEVTIAEALIRSEMNTLFENETITFIDDQTYEVFIDSNLETGSWNLNEEQTSLTISPMGDVQIAVAVTSLSDEVLQIAVR